MLIGELSKQTGLSRDTIRFYEKQGLIPLGVKDNEFNSYKNYSNKTLEKLLVIKKMKKFSFTLKEISNFLELLEFNSATCDNVSKTMLMKTRLIDDKIRELKEMRNLIMDSLDSCPTQYTKSENCALISIDV